MIYNMCDSVTFLRNEVPMSLSFLLLDNSFQKNQVLDLSISHLEVSCISARWNRKLIYIYIYIWGSSKIPACCFLVG